MDSCSTTLRTHTLMTPTLKAFGTNTVSSRRQTQILSLCCFILFSHNPLLAPTDRERQPCYITTYSPHCQHQQNKLSSPFTFYTSETVFIGPSILFTFVFAFCFTVFRKSMTMFFFTIALGTLESPFIYTKREQFFFELISRIQVFTSRCLHCELQCSGTF